MNKKHLLTLPELNKFIVENDLMDNDRFFSDNSSVLEDFYDQKKHPLFPDYRPVLRLVDGKAEIFYEADSKTHDVNQFRIGEPEDFFDLNFGKFDTDEYRNEALIAAVEFVREYKKNTGFVKGIYLWGNFGVGKSYLMAALLNELSSQGVQTAFVNMTGLISRLNRISMVEKQRLIRRLANVELLLFDDIGAGDLTSWFRDSVLGTILDQRMVKKRSTLFTSNFDLDSLRDQYLSYSRNIYEPVKAARIIDRVKFLSRPVLMSGKSRRI
ncbi:AFG1/ZapE family ATPase [Oenococcus alcoholitolerans]|uniref:AFG1/ZapE family ATPase n=1 Tax=Oenococcus alcoholitolerans TaxID=931074 RepID=UPI003F700B9B